MLRRQAKKLIARFSSNHYQTLNRVELSRSNLLANLELFRRNHPEAGIIPVLKGNAYGHGIEQVAGMLNGTACDFLAVDGYFEAAKIRDITTHHLLILGYIKPENVRLLDTQKCSFVVQDIDGLRAFGVCGKPVRLHLELNTGMNRLGLSVAEIPDFLKTIRQYSNLKLEGVMTHLADADNAADDSFTTRQAKEFDEMVDGIRLAGFSPRYIHIAQTAGSTKITSRHANSIRLGIGLYGINPLHSSDKHFGDLHGLKPVMELKSTVIKIVDLKKGDRVSYNGIFTAPADLKIAVLPLGYYEGVPRELSNKGVFMYGGHQLPIAGRVCMNHVMVKLGGADLQVGDEVVVISNNPADPNSVQAICQRYQLFNYVLLTKISSSVKRVIV